jgi:hypothetical protein
MGASADTLNPLRTVENECDGGAERDRTADLVIANDALSQLSYSPIRHDS